MKRKELLRASLTFSLILIIAAASAGQAGAEESQEFLNTAGRTRLELSALIGGGFKSHDIGTTSSGETARISGGGGLGAALGLGYGVNRTLDLDLTFGVQQSTMSPPVTNASGKFDRTFVLADLLYKIPYSSTSQVKVGGGLGRYLGGALDVDTSSVAGGGHTIVKYDDAFGIHFSGGVEVALSNNVYLSVGGRLTLVSYKAKASSLDGVQVPVTSLTSDIRGLSGSGLDFVASIGAYF